MTAVSNVVLNGDSVDLASIRLAAAGVQVELGGAARAKLVRARETTQRAIANGATHYGINTGFGPFARRRISASDIEKLQLNLIRSHASGFGEPLPVPLVRAMMVLRAHSLSLGYSGVGPALVEKLIAYLNKDIVPVVPEKGSVGASGDLAPLAHIGLALLGEGDVFCAGERLPAARALERFGLQAHLFGPKEGLALINGTQYMCGAGILALAEAQQLLHAATIAAAMSIEALLGTIVAFDAELHALRRHQGQRAVAANLRMLLDRSAIVASHANCDAVQDAYSLRCTPQVLGASQDALRYASAVLEDEANAVTDNPLVFPEDGRVVSGGNFHGQPVALVLDQMSIAIAEIASIAERRLFNLLHCRDVPALPACLAGQGGLESGLMIAQYVAAALVSENRTLGHPATLDNVVTGGGAEDHNSMGSIAAARLPRLLNNARGVIAAELLAAAQALEFHRPLAPARATAQALACVRRHVARIEADRSLTPDLEALARPTFLAELITSVEDTCGRALAVRP